jgi:2-amino-4-hydroxy-6-hydroxymethyldihydropteridine diphosphokinase
MERVFLGLGANVGDREDTIRRAVSLISEVEDVRLVSTSSLFETEPVGITEQPPFINATAEVETGRLPRELFTEIKVIEKKLGRTETVRWGPRVIDIDILLFGQNIIDERDLVIPHPEMTERAFVLVPLSEIAPDVLHPIEGKTIRELLLDLDKREGVVRYGDFD